MLPIATVLLASSILLPAGVVAQNSTTAKATCLPGVAPWSYNSEGDSPCDIAMSLAGVCIGTTFTLAPLGPDFVYLGPDPLNANACRCSSVYYSVLSACANCQDRQWIDWDIYKSNCTTVYSQVFAKPLPVGVGVPHYAYLDVSATNTFDLAAASSAGGPESTRLPGATGTSTPHPTEHKKSNTGAIVGGVVGGVVGLLVIAGLVFWLIRQRNAKKATASSYDPDLLVGSTEPSPQMQYTSPTPAPSAPESSFLQTHVTGTSVGQRIYDPNDPSTFPSSGHGTGNTTHTSYDTSLNMSTGQMAYQQPQMVQYTDGASSFQQPLDGASPFQQPLTPPRPHYTGAPEI